MRHLLASLLVVCACAASAQVESAGPAPFPDVDPDVTQGGLAWLVGDHAKARRHFRAAAQRGHPLGQYNLAMMLLHREGGPGDAAAAMALLRKAAEGDVVLAREALDAAKTSSRTEDSPRRPPAERRVARERTPSAIY